MTNVVHAIVAALLASPLEVLACSPAGKPIVAEVYYDAPGEDTGWEFVELFDPLDRDVPLAGLKLEAGDGAAAGRWTTRWTGGAADTIRARGRFVIGGGRWSPPPDAVVTLDLQNGPDAMRLVWPDGAVEVVGWGALAYPEYFCGAPAADVPAGQSLARVPDDAALGTNALDFRAADPSPGRANLPYRDLALDRGTLAASPEQPAPLEAMRVRVRVRNRGAAGAAAFADTLVLRGDALAESTSLALPALGSGDTLTVSLAASAGEAGRRTLVALVRAAGDAVSGDDADTLALRVGPGPLELTEIQFHPAAGEGEWVEVRNRSPEPLRLSDFTFSDRADGRSHVLDSLEVSPDSLALLVQDRAALIAAFANLDAGRVARVSPWPALNNANAADGTADVVTLRERDGLPSDRVAYSASGVPAGATLEKAAGGWRSSPTRGGTPLAPPAEAAPGAAAFRVAPRRLALGSPATHLAWTLPWPSATVSAALYDLDGRFVASLFDDAPSGSTGGRDVRLDGAGAGVFAIVLRAHGDAGALVRSAIVRIGGPRP